MKYIFVYYFCIPYKVLRLQKVMYSVIPTYANKDNWFYYFYKYNI